MSHKRVILSLTILALALSVGFAQAAEGLRDMQLFAPANVNGYGGPRQANEGFYFNFDMLVWSISAPEVRPIGQPSEFGRLVYYGPTEADTATQNNTHDTSIFGAEVVTGQRYTGGYMCGHQGLMFSGWRLNSQTQNVATAQMDMVFDDFEWGGALDFRHLDGYVDEAQTIIRPLPVTFASANIRNRVETWGVELNYVIRSSQMHGGGYVECFLGPRYLEFDDNFNLHAYGYVTPITVSGETVGSVDTLPSVPPTEDQDEIYVGTLANSIWDQDARNHIIAPQIGARWFNYYGRWMLSAEGRFFFGYNTQTLYQEGIVGSELNPNPGLLNQPSLPGHVPQFNVPLALEGTTFIHEKHENEWSPGVELGVNLDWQWTRNISLGAGWNGMWIDGIARASNLINYEFGTSSLMGILTENNRQHVFITGATFRIVVNR